MPLSKSAMDMEPLYNWLIFDPERNTMMDHKDIDALAVILTYMETGRIGVAHDLLEKLH